MGMEWHGTVRVCQTIGFTNPLGICRSGRISRVGRIFRYVSGENFDLTGVSLQQKTSGHDWAGCQFV